jgi:hypothetical protein
MKATELRGRPQAEIDRVMRAAADAVADEYAPCGALNLETDDMEQDPMMRWFSYEHLPEHLQVVSRGFYALADSVCQRAEPGPERTVALRKLLEAKDAAVRAVVHPGG